MGANEVLVPTSSTNTSRFGSISAASVTLQAALKYSSLSTDPTVRFLTEAKTLRRLTDG